VEECTYFWGVNTSWGINTAESKRPLNQEDNQAPQPTKSFNNINHYFKVYFKIWTLMVNFNFTFNSQATWLEKALIFEERVSCPCFDGREAHPIEDF
jgi:hypothetical protein